MVFGKESVEKVIIIIIIIISKLSDLLHGSHLDEGNRSRLSDLDRILK